MNPVPPCGCFFPAFCDSCRTPCPTPTCSSSPGRKLKAEPQHKNQPVCSINNCVIYGGHDVNPFPEYPCPAKNIKIKDENRNSLGSPIGLVTSNVNFKTEGNPTDIIQARYATYLKAFARLHLNSEATWTPALIDDIMKEGLLLYTTSEKNENKLESPSNIYTSSEKNILREFKMNDCNFQVELMPKFTLNVTASAEMGAYGDGADNLTLEDLKPALKDFFRQHKYCLLTVRSSFYIMIWRSRDAYFIFDVCGRRISDFRIDHDEGVAMLMCLKTLENLRHLVVNLSSLRMTNPISLREMKIVKVTTPSGGVIQRDYNMRTHQFEVINDDYAYLKAGLHLTLNKADLLRNRSALPVGVAAMVVSKIDHPATWNTKMVDKIFCFGVNFCQVCWIKCMTSDPIDVTEFPCVFNMGQFRISIELIARKYEGLWRCVPGFQYSELAQAIENAFEAGDQKVLVQINYQIYAIWKKHAFIYLLDPFRHRILGKEDESDVYDQMEKSATVRMFRNFEVFMNTFNHILLDSNRTSQFSIHILKIKNIQQNSALEEETKLDINGEVISINEHICFEEAEDLCQKALGEISDYEDEDLKSDVDEMELKTSSSEDEDVIDEEEGIGGAAEELEGLESSSSSEEDTDHKKKGAGSKGSKISKANKGQKVGRGRKRRDDRSSKGTKGKGAKDDEGGKKRKKSDHDNSSDEVGRKKQKNQDDKESSKIKVKDDNDKGKNKNEHHGDKKGKNYRNNEAEYGKAKDKNSKGKGKDGKSKEENDNVDNKAKGKDIDMDTNYVKKDENANKKYFSKDENKTTKDLAKESDKNKKTLDKLGDKDKSQSEVSKTEKKEKGGINKNQDDTLDKNRDINNYLDNRIDKDKETDNERERDKSKDKDSDLRKENDNNKDSEKNKDNDNKKAKDSKKDKEVDKNESKNNRKENEVIQNDKSVIEGTIYDSMNTDKDGINKDIRVQTRVELPYDGAEADDENEDKFLKNSTLYCSGPNPNNYPGYFKCPLDIAVVGSKSGSYASICKLFQAGFKIADRILTMTPWGNFVVFRCLGKIRSEEKHYFVFDGCTCNVSRFRHLDLSVGTAGLICFDHMHNVIEYIRQVRKLRNKDNRQRLRNETVDEICRQYCS